MYSSEIKDDIKIDISLGYEYCLNIDLEFEKTKRNKNKLFHFQKCK